MTDPKNEYGVNEEREDSDFRSPQTTPEQTPQASNTQTPQYWGAYHYAKTPPPGYYQSYGQYRENTQNNSKKASYLSKRGAIAIVALSLVFSLITGALSFVLASAYTNNGKSPLFSSPTNSNIQISDGSVQNNVDEEIVSQGERLTIKQIATKNQDSVVEIITSTTQGSFFNQAITNQGAGSGVIVSSDGYIATNYHVIEDTDSIYVRLHNGTEFEASVRGYDEKTDLAVIKIEAADLVPATFGISANLAVGDTVVAIGNPLGELGGTVTNGIVSATERDITTSDGIEMTLLQTNAAVNPGNSGGGLFNDYGELIGIVNAKSYGTGIEGLGYAIPSDIAYPIIIDLIEAGYVRGRFSLGVQVLNILTESAARYWGVSELGVYINQVYENSNAKRAGLRSGDYVVSINGTEIKEYDDLKAMLEASSVGDTLIFEIKRAGKLMTVNVVLNEDRSDAQTII